MQKKEIVIKLPRTWETQVKIMTDSEIADYLYNVIRNGTVLEPHGRLIDIDNIQEITLEDSLTILTHTKGDEVDCYIDAPTILEGSGI